MVMPWRPSSFKASRTSSSLKGFMMASIFFISCSPFDCCLAHLKGPLSVNSVVEADDFALRVNPDAACDHPRYQRHDPGPRGHEGDGGNNGYRLNAKLCGISVKQSGCSPGY